jgi:hypothetical protein
MSVLTLVGVAASLVLAQPQQAPSRSPPPPAANAQRTDPPCPPAGCPIPVPYPPPSSGLIVHPVAPPTRPFHATTGDEAGTHKRETAPAPPPAEPASPPVRRSPN